LRINSFTRKKEESRKQKAEGGRRKTEAPFKDRVGQGLGKAHQPQCPPVPETGRRHSPGRLAQLIIIKASLIALPVCLYDRDEVFPLLSGFFCLLPMAEN